jgi:hypothetical protein
VRDAAFSLFAGALVHNQNPLTLLYLGGQRQRSAVSVYRMRVRELIEGFPEHVLPKNMDTDGQYEPLASSESSAWPNLCIHTTSNLESRPVWAQWYWRPKRVGGRFSSQLELTDCIQQAVVMYEADCCGSCGSVMDS